MALGSTVYKATLDISDLDRGYYATHVLTVARHPSETEERLMLRILAFASLAGEHLEFGRGRSSAAVFRPKGSPRSGRSTTRARSNGGLKWAVPTCVRCAGRRGEATT